MTTSAKLPAPPAEPAESHDLAGLAPRFRDALERVLGRLAQRGVPARVAETLRSEARQRWLFGFGRTWDDGRGRVTAADSALTSWHGYGLAADVVSVAHAWDAPAPFWEALRDAAEAEGLRSGAEWGDSPHVQWGTPMRASPSAEARRLLSVGGVEAVWRAVGAAGGA